ncbi:MAG TPA: DUF3106 domain-containing protein [Acidisarcina sp.]|nr:DUF3106 domain-containing protein [Acidisarcina sp.]
MKRHWNRLNPATQSGEQRPVFLPYGRGMSLRIGSWIASGIFLGSLVVAAPLQGLAQQHAPAYRGGQPAMRFPAQNAPSFQRGAPRPAQAPRPQSQYQQSQQHLGDWLHTHQNLAPAEQEKALQREPGFNKLPQEQQQRLMNRLRDLNNKSPQQRQRTIDRVEVWERLSPQQKREISNSTAQLRSMPPERQVPLRRAFRDLREVPPGQRQAILNSPEYQSQFTPQERGILSNLLTIEPYQANPSAPADSPARQAPIPAYR